MNSKKVFILLAIVFLTACGGGQVTAGVPSSILATTEAASSSTPTLFSTKTPFPTLESIAAVPAATLNAVATLDVIRIDLINQFPELQEYRSSCDLLSCYNVKISPTEQWIYFSNGNVIDLFRVDGQRVGMYSFYDIYGYLINYGGGYVFPVHWAKDGRYLYITANIGGDGGPEPYFNYESALVRVNLENGTWKDVGISGSSKFSQNDKFIIFSSKSQIRVRNLSTDQEKIYSALGYYLYFGKYVWSPDSKKVVFAATPEDWYSPDSKFALFMIDLESEIILQLYESSLPFYYPVSWTESDKVILNKFNHWGEWILDLSVTPPTINP